MYPIVYQDALNCKNSRKWRNAMENELASLEQNKTWLVVNEPEDKNIIEVKWIYRIKSDGTYKARLVAKGSQQIFEEHEEIYSPVARMTDNT